VNSKISAGLHICGGSSSTIWTFSFAYILSLALPPCNPSVRKSLHHFGNKIGLKSKSHGLDNSRFTILSKTTTLDYIFNEREFYRLANRTGLRNSLRPKTNASSGNWEDHDPKADPAWGDEPVQRAGALKAKGWMQKMGWTEGQGLGSSSNKGIVVPIQVEHRSARGGLGWGG
jgi:hypothetical protein